jgi:hypothetical protein
VPETKEMRKYFPKLAGSTGLPLVRIVGDAEANVYRLVSRSIMRAFRVAFCDN